MIRTYSEMLTFSTIEERFEYLNLHGQVGEATFGSRRYLNQLFYKSKEWRQFRDLIIVRDGACEFGLEEYPIDDPKLIRVHHIVPITIEDILNRDPKLFDPNNVVCVSDLTHKAIHYGNKDLLPIKYTERTKNDTCPWKK